MRSKFVNQLPFNNKANNERTNSFNYFPKSFYNLIKQFLLTAA